jgi:hypothetical protein
MNFKHIENEIAVWHDWQIRYKEFVPKFIQESLTKNKWEDWDKDIFHEFFERSNNQCVASLRQGYFTKNEKNQIKKNWDEVSPILKSISSNQEETIWENYNALVKVFRKYTKVNRYAATHRIVASLQPKLLCTIVNHSDLKELYNYLKSDNSLVLPDVSNNWFKDSHSLSVLFQDNLSVSNFYESITYPWQFLEFYRKKDKKINNLIKVYKNNILTSDWLDDELYKFEWANWLSKKVHISNQSEEEILNICLASQEEQYSTSKGVQFIKSGAREQLSKFISIDDIKIFKDFSSGLELEELDCSGRNMSYPILSCYLSVFCPDLVLPASKTSFANICSLLFDVKLSKSGMGFVIGVQPYMERIKDKLYDEKEILSSLRSKLDKNRLENLDINWLTQDFLLFLDRNQNLIEPENIINKTKKERTMLTKHPLNQILYGPPGTGKTYATKEMAVSIIDESFISNLDDNLSTLERRREIKNRYKEFCDSGQIVFTTFHQSLGYEDFIEGIKPIPPVSDDSPINYKIENGIFKSLCKKATEIKSSNNFEEAYSEFVSDVIEAETIELKSLKQQKPFNVRINRNHTAVAMPKTELATPMGITKEMMREYIVNDVVKDWRTYTTSIGEYIKENYNISVESNSNKPKNHVLIIDEINRGNVSAIFGELITLIESDKRIGEEEELSVKLPYSKEDFGIPSNLFVIGTMNTADRSVEALDTALRRRFNFTEKMPNPDILEDKEINGINLSEVLKTINDRIEVLIDRDHTIGHSYFINVNSPTELADAFNNKIVPLLQEYFYGDYGKIGLVLGEGFVKKEDNDKIRFSSFKYDNKQDFINYTYKLLTINEENIVIAVGNILKTDNK